MLSSSPIAASLSAGGMAPIDGFSAEHQAFTVFYYITVT
jgi:hypothetical protein